MGGGGRKGKGKGRRGENADTSANVWRKAVERVCCADNDNDAMRCRISIGLRVALGQHDVRVDSDVGIGCGGDSNSDSDGIIRCLAEAATSVANERLACER